MSNYEVQFDEGRVVEKFQTIRAINRKQRSTTLFVLEHELKGDIAAAIESTWDFSDVRYKYYGSPPTIHQSAYVDNLGNSGSLVFASLDDLIRLCFARQIPEKVQEEMRRTSEHLVHRLKALSHYLPATETVLQLGEVSEKRQETLERIDISYAMTFYTYNLEFASNFQRGIYNFREDVGAFWGAQFARPRTKYSVILSKPLIVPLETTVDYFGNVVMPLIKNIQQHAFNQENDIGGRLQNKDKPFYRSFNMYTEVDEEHQEIIVTMRDFGFGIKPEIQNILFQRGTTSKTDTKTQHGIGLWAVKEFVERNGGRIWFESVLGMGSSFHFTIPYRAKEHFFYRQ